LCCGAVAINGNLPAGFSKINVSSSSYDEWLTQW